MNGAPSMLGKQYGFIAHIKELCPSIRAVHCVVHRHHLVAKKISSDLHESLRLVIQKIKQSRSVNTIDFFESDALILNNST